MSNSPCFPPELERYIFETAALLYPHTISRLLPVARRVLIWIEPLLYRRVYFDGLIKKSGPAAAILRAIQNGSKPTDFFATTTRYLCIASLELNVFFSRPEKREWSNGNLETVFRACSGVDNLFFFGDIEKPKLLEMVTETMRPRRIVMILDLVGTQPDLSLSLFDNITHLLLGDINLPNNILDENWDQLANLQNLPRLTHLALSECSTSLVLVSMLLSGCTHLQCFVVFTQDPIPSLDGIHDARFSIVLTPEGIILDDGVPRDLWARVEGGIRRYTDVFRLDS
ncbi:hypothetical protein R3P38DRAFT_2495866 [Favolaschia claudopus]|uniref:F-box domain-containing protein n=1 Tax=Favolaschia claudopus TaxID=2862362 RepID=A0AAW0EAQ9_9AGAR